MGNDLLKNSRTARTVFVSALLTTVMIADAMAQAIPSTVEPTHIQKTLSAPSGVTAAPESSVPVQAPMQQPQLPSELTKKSFVLNGVDIKGVTVYSPEEMKKFYAPFIGKKVSLADMQQIIQAITAKYRSDDYVLSQAIIPPQKMKDGRVTIQVFEGYIHDVTFQGDTAFSGPRNLLANYAEKIKA